MKKSVRIVSAVLSMFLVSGMMTACSKTSKTKKSITVSKDDPWFDSSRFTLSMEKSDKDMLMIDSSPEYCNGKIYSTYSTYDLATYDEKVKLDVYSEDGTKEKALEMTFSEDVRVQEIYSLVPNEDGKTALALVNVFNGGNEACFATVDLETGKASDVTPVQGKNGQKIEMITSVSRVGDYIAVQSSLMGTGDSQLYFYKGKDLFCEMDMTTLSGSGYIDAISYNEKTKKAYANVQNMKGEKYFCEMDLASGKFTKTTPFVSGGENEDNLTDYQCTGQGYLLRVDTLGNIYKYNAETNAEEKVLDNNWYSPYFYDFNPDKNPEISVLHYSEEKIVLYFHGTDGFPTARLVDSDICSVMVLTKTQTNPHEGKKVIEISAPLDGSFSDYLSSAIVSFNETDPEYLIRIWSKYNDGIKAGRGFPMLDPQIERAYTLVRELEGSDCPDIVVNMDKKEAMNDKTLLDMSAFLDESVKQELFDNILQASKVDGKLYFIPVTLEVEGLIVKEEDVGKDKTGMTFEEYGNYVENALSGAQPYDYPESRYNYRDVFLMSCIDMKSAVEGEKVDFDSEQFRKAAEYAKGNFAENRGNPDEYIPFAEEEQRPRPDGRYVHMTNFINYVMNCSGEQDVCSVIGTPSVTGQGPRFTAQESISVAAKSGQQEGCKKFINYLLGGKFISKEELSISSICINKDAMKSEISLISKYYNEIYEYEMEYGLFNKSQLKTMGYKEATETMQQKFYDMLSTLSVYYMDDKEIKNIINEELAAYYSGDKSIDDVIRFINDRVTKYVNEAR